MMDRAIIISQCQIPACRYAIECTTHRIRRIGWRAIGIAVIRQLFFRAIRIDENSRIGRTRTILGVEDQVIIMHPSRRQARRTVSLLGATAAERPRKADVRSIGIGHRNI